MSPSLSALLLIDITLAHMLILPFYRIVRTCDREGCAKHLLLCWLWASVQSFLPLNLGGRVMSDLETNTAYCDWLLNDCTDLTNGVIQCHFSLYNDDSDKM